MEHGLVEPQKITHHVGDRTLGAGGTQSGDSSLLLLCQDGQTLPLAALWEG